MYSIYLRVLERDLCFLIDCLEREERRYFLPPPYNNSSNFCKLLSKFSNI